MSTVGDVWTGRFLCLVTKTRRAAFLFSVQIKQRCVVHLSRKTFVLNSFYSSDIFHGCTDMPPSVLWPVSQDRLSSLKLWTFLLLLQHLGADLCLLLQGFRLFIPSTLGLHPGDETEQGSSKDGGDSCQVESHIIAAQSVPEETCNQEESRRMLNQCMSMNTNHTYVRMHVCMCSQVHRDILIFLALCTTTMELK